MGFSSSPPPPLPPPPLPPPTVETPEQKDAKLNEIARQRRENRKRQVGRASLRTDGTGLSIPNQTNSGIGQ